QDFSSQIDAISNSLPVFSFDSSAIGAVIPPGDSLEIAVTFTPDSSAQYTDTLYVEIEDVVLSAVLSGTGIGAYISLSEDSLDFGLWEPNAPYPTRNFTIANLGNDTLEVDSIISDNPAFLLSSGTGLTLLPGETSNPITITFQPPGEGFHEGYILLPNNAYNFEDDTAMVYVSGWWEYTPAPVYDLTVGIEGINAVLNWSPVDTSIFGNPIVVDLYLIFFETDPYSDYEFLAGVTGTTYTHELVVQFSPAMFYYVEAYIGDIGILDEIISSGAPISREELLEKIFTAD
ncbi:choice-of-anchor D domain-containing protein, partial [bacterium]|nr:choice-of-anchor D domain-containing protein [bacterium]